MADHFSTYLRAVVEGGTLPGIDVTVMRKDGTKLFRETHGLFADDQIYRIYSNTKPVISVAILILIERGLLTLDTELRAILPQFAAQTVLTGGTVDAEETEPLKRQITIKHLLQHTSGLSYAIFGDLVVDQLLKKNIGEDHVTFFENTPLDVLIDRIAEVIDNRQSLPCRRDVLSLLSAFSYVFCYALFCLFYCAYGGFPAVFLDFSCCAVYLLLLPV
jgi:hypothetical protein